MVAPGLGICEKLRVMGKICWLWIELVWLTLQRRILRSWRGKGKQFYAEGSEGGKEIVGYCVVGLACAGG